MPFASEIGRWDPRFNSEGVAAMHLHLLPTGEVLYHDVYSVNNIRLWNPVTGQFKVVPPPPPAGDRHVIFCSGHSFLADGRLLFAGGGSAKETAPRWRASTTHSPWTPGRSCRS